MTGPLEITAGQARSFRLRKSFLLGNPHTDPIEISSKLCGIQAQVLSAAKLSLGIRSGRNADEIEKYFHTKNGLVKTWTMRGTLHAIPAKDISLYSSALGFDTIDRYILHWKKNYDITKKDSLQLIETLDSLLTTTPKTKREFSAPAAEQLGAWVKPIIENGWGGAIKCLCNQGLAVFSEPRGQEVTFARRERYLSKWIDRNPEEAQDTILRMYLSTYGPSTVSDFSYWLGRPVPFVQKIWDRLQPELLEVHIAGKRSFLLRTGKKDLLSAKPLSSHFKLLPFFDAYLLPHRKKAELVEDRHYKKIFRSAGWISQSI
ncbi:MAG: winged helix DNA-binding domain-containing protein, partial [Candidatus Kapaibacterium sp.]